MDIESMVMIRRFIKMGMYLLPVQIPERTKDLTLYVKSE